MSIKDGEYDIDLSGLIDVPNSNNIALRYGFIPDSMDQKSSLKLYQMGNECLLSVQSNESDKNIIFEGIPQLHKSGNIANDSYYLQFYNDNVAHLKRLNSTIRLSKSRNADKLSAKLKSWDKQYSQTKASTSTSAVPSSSSNTRSSQTLQPSNLRNKIGKLGPNKLTGSPSEKLLNLHEPSQNKPNTVKDVPSRPVSSKRPPTANSTPIIDKEPIISALDFDDLEDDSFDQFPVIVINDEPIVKPNQSLHKSTKAPPSAKSTTPSTTSTRTASKAKEPKLKQNTSKQKPREKKVVNEDVDMEDDFKDLEDQLAEVLEEDKPVDNPNNQPTKKPDTIPKLDIDSDESDFDEFEFSGIKIDNGTSDTSTKSSFISKPLSNHKPVSLRDFNNDMSSSEEE